jgi:AraC-like DNA-binding protein
MLLRAAERLQDPLLGLHLGQAIRPAHLGALGYLLQACENLGAVLIRIQRYHRLLNDINPIEYRIDGKRLELCWGIEHGKPGALFDEGGVTAFVELGRRLCEQMAPMQAVDFVNPPPSNPQPFHAYFGCTVRWGQPLTRLVMPLSVLKAPLSRADPVLLRLMEAQADKALSDLPDMGDLADLTRRVVINLARDGVPDLEHVATALKLSPRVFYRRLAKAGLSFRDLRESALRQIAESHLLDSRLSVAEVGQLLGYAEPSAFSRAFRRWTGYSPLVWRKGHEQALTQP